MFLEPFCAELLSSSRKLSKNIKIKIYRTVILLFFGMGVKLGLSYWGRNIGWGCSRIRCWKRNLGLRGARQQMNGEDYITSNLMICAPHNNIILVIKQRIIRWARNVARIGDRRGANRVLMGISKGKRPLGRPRIWWEDKMYLEEVGRGDMDWMDLAQGRDMRRNLVNAVMNLRVP